MTPDSDPKQVVFGAFKRKYRFADGGKADKYEVFLKQNLHNLNPTFYGIIRSELLETTDGPMYRLALTEALDDPALDIVAECLINNQYVYLWRDSAWTLGIGTHLESLRKFFGADFQASLSNQSFTECTIVIYPIGTPPAWMQETDDNL